MAIIKLKLRKMYTCSICKKEFEWGEESSWYGTLENTELIACSEKCKEKSGKIDD